MQAETAELILSRALVSYPNSNIDESATLVLWLEQFDKVDDALIKDAFNLTLKRCKFFPSVADIEQSLNEMRQQKRATTETPILDRAKNFDSPTAKKVFGTVKMLGERHLAIQVEPEIVNYARAKFPMISDQLIKDNYLEILFAKEGSEKCFGCMWHFADCETHGFFPRIELS